MNEDSTMKCEFSASIEIEIFETFENAESSIKSTSRGIVIDLRAEGRGDCIGDIQCNILHTKVKTPICCIPTGHSPLANSIRLSSLGRKTAQVPRA
jgi:hypothetical protein